MVVDFRVTWMLVYFGWSSAVKTVMVYSINVDILKSNGSFVGFGIPKKYRNPNHPRRLYESHPKLMAKH